LLRNTEAEAKVFLIKKTCTSGTGTGILVAN